MIAPVVLMLALSFSAPADTTRFRGSDSAVGPVASALVAAVQIPDDTVRRQRRKSIEVSEWYERRLRIHRYGSYAIYPLFAVQAVAGNQLFQDPKLAPEWAKTTHRIGATGLATAFTLNTVTGLWNLWDSREVEQGRARRYVHALLMLASDAGFTYAGVRLSDQAENSFDKRKEHRTWAYGSMATALTGIGVMTLWKEN
ncbi:MAG: putative rane protein [Gemmatimonadetes bacterium]|nr:putative rane protein [Gemmatimonadota bacterium]